MHQQPPANKPGTVQVWPPVTTNRIVQTLIYRLATHPLMKEPLIYDEKGFPFRINKYRNFDGHEFKNTDGITMSIFPYHYSTSDAGTSLTVNTENAALYFEPYNLGANGADPTSLERVTANIVVKLSAFGFSQEDSSDQGQLNPQQNTQFEFNYVEWTLRQYLEYIAAVLRGQDINKLPRFHDGVNLLSNSFVKNGQFPTSRWETGSNSVLHSASLLWQVQYYVPREWKLPERLTFVEMSDGNLLVGKLNEQDLYYDSLRDRFLAVDGTELIRSDLNDPVTGQLYTTLDADLISLIDTSPKSLLDFSFYLKREIQQ